MILRTQIHCKIFPKTILSNYLTPANLLNSKTKINAMTFQATIHLNKANIGRFQTDIGSFQTSNPPTQFLVLELDAPSPESAHQAIKHRWKKIRQQLPEISTPRLLQVVELTVRCPRCGASEMSFCKH